MPNGLSRDTLNKRAMYIERNLELMQEFPFAHPEVKCNINRIYNTAFPGSTLYDLTSASVRQLTNSWSVSVRKMWELPVQAHRYLIEPLSGCHAHTMLIVRFVKFLQSMLKFSEMAVHFMLRKVEQDASSTTGKNLAYIRKLVGTNCDLLTVSPKWLKKQVPFQPMNESDKWRVTLIKEVANIRNDVLSLQSDSETFLTSEQLKDIVDFVSCY